MKENSWDDLFEFAYFNRLDDSLAQLSNLAELEDWSSSEDTTKPHFILHHYIRYTFK